MAEDTSQNDPFLNPSRRSYVYESSKNSGNRSRIILIIIGVIILIALIAFAVIATGGRGEQEVIPTPTETVETPTPTVAEETPTPEEDSIPTPTTKTTPAPTTSSGLDRSDLSIAIQNGSGVAGAATKASDFLEGLGYNVTSTGNADNFDYTETIIRVKSSMEEYLDQLEEDLSGEYTIGEATADYTGSGDALVIIGAE
jgi:hypothetical protein